MNQPSERAGHWDDVYRSRGVEGLSWYQPEATLSLELVHLLGAKHETPIIDIGGGASSFVDLLLRDGFEDISVLNISTAALSAARQRVGEDAPVTWIHEDILSWRPSRRYGLWHDRAVFHFLTDEGDRARYLENLTIGLEPGGALIVATFAEDGPDHCSGLPVVRYSSQDLMNLLDSGFELVDTRRELHVTPARALQPFTWVTARSTRSSRR